MKANNQVQDEPVAIGQPTTQRSNDPEVAQNIQMANIGMTGGVMPANVQQMCAVGPNCKEVANYTCFVNTCCKNRGCGKAFCYQHMAKECCVTQVQPQEGVVLYMACQNCGPSVARWNRCAVCCRLSPLIFLCSVWILATLIWIVDEVM